jgi:hypothetical protein
MLIYIVIDYEGAPWEEPEKVISACYASKEAAERFATQLGRYAEVEEHDLQCKSYPSIPSP